MWSIENAAKGHGGALNEIPIMKTSVLKVLLFKNSSGSHNL